jgi:DNA-binding LacI/PurR family transcriptional regulator
VSRHADVDPSTASRVLRGGPNQGVRDDTRGRILDPGRMLNYRPNAVAQSLRTRHTDTIAVIMQRHSFCRYELLTRASNVFVVVRVAQAARLPL